MGIEVLERVAEAGGQLLMVEASRRPDPVRAEESRAAALLLTFDLGRIALCEDPRGGELEVEGIESRDRAPEDLGPAGEDEPWWRLLGLRLSRAERLAGEGGAGAALALHFGAGDLPTKCVVLRSTGRGLSARLEADRP